MDLDYREIILLIIMAAWGLVMLKVWRVLQRKVRREAAAAREQEQSLKSPAPLADAGGQTCSPGKGE